MSESVAEYHITTSDAPADRDWRAQAVSERCAYVEHWPGATPPPLDTVQRRMSSGNPPRGSVFFAAFGPSDGILGSARLGMHPAEAKRALLGIYVLPEVRGQGIGNDLLKSAISVARERHVEVFEVKSASCAPAGEPFVSACGGQLTNSTHVLEITDRDFRQRSQRWHDGQGMITDTADLGGMGLVSFGVVDGPFPQHHIPEIWRLKRTIAVMYGRSPQPPSSNQAIKECRVYEEWLNRVGIERLVVLAAASSRSLIGFVEAIWDPSEPDVLRTNGICVSDPYRGSGLASALAAQLVRVLDLKPSVTSLRTTLLPSSSRAASGGWTLHHVENTWDVPVSRADRYLVERTLERRPRASAVARRDLAGRTVRQEQVL